MRRLITVAVVVAGVALPVSAQRSGGGHSGGAVAGHSGGSAIPSFSTHSAPVFHSAPPSMGRVNFMGSPQLSDNRYSVAPGLSPGRGPVAGNSNRRPGYPGRRDGYRDYRRSYSPVYGVGFPTGFSIYPGSLLDTGFSYGPGYYDNSGYAVSGNTSPAPPVDYSPQPYVAPPVEQSEVAPPNAYRPAYQKPQPPPEPEAAVTLVFKDGRPTEQIHNYMLTRTTLYVQDEHRREIPVDDLDLAATQKINKEDGVDFQLPSARR